jgi:thiamine biosynthesis lipoprotein ApbE
MDPRTGKPAQGVLTVAVLASTGTDGDALDDAFFVLGPERSAGYLHRLRATDAFFFLPAAAHAWTMVHRRSGTP